MKPKHVLLALSLSMTSSVFAFTGVQAAHVVNVGTYGNGSMFIYVDKVINEPGCAGGQRIDMPGTHPEVANWMALAMTAMSTNKVVNFRVDGCYQSDATIYSPTMSTNGFTSYFLLSN